MNGKWDENSIDSAYEELLESVGSLLNKVALFGLDILLRRKRYFRLYLELLKELEKELLIQWKVKREKGLNRLRRRQCNWYRRELRRSGGTFSVWNRLYFEIRREAEASSSPKTDNDLWKTILTEDLTDFDLISQAVGEKRVNTSVLKKICEVFGLTIRLNPYWAFIGFLDLIEIGLGFRPKIHPLHMDDPLFPSDMSELPFELPGRRLSSESWEKLPDMLLKLWKRRSDQSPAESTSD